MSVRSCVMFWTAGILWVLGARSAVAQVTVEQIFKYRPVQKDVDIETPAAADLPKCKVEVERPKGKSSGWAAYGPQGQILRRFVDTDGDNVVDQWRYYKNGLEVYRDMDTNADNDVDQSRWMTTGGTRWGIDANQDGKIDRWKMISAEEASREAIRALAAGDVEAFTAVLISAEDIKTLGLSAEVAQKLQAVVKDPAAHFSAARSGSKILKPETKWVRFDSSMLMPNTIPVEMGVADRDLIVYQNVMAIVDTAGETGFVQIGEMVRVPVMEGNETVGEVWKLTGVPKPIEGDAPIQVEAGVLMNPAFASLAAAGVAEPSPEMRQLIEQLQKLDQTAQQNSNASASELAEYNAQRAQLLGRLAEVATTNEERDIWRRQQIDQIAEAVRRGEYPNGVDVLKGIETELRKRPDGAALVPYAAYRRMMADYYNQLALADASTRVEVQTKWIAALEQFVSDYPESEDAADALLQIAMTDEFGGKVTEAKEHYARVVESHPKSPAAVVANGALRRLNLKGQPLELSGPALGGQGTIDIARLRGKVVAVLFWATWCRPCTEDLPQIQELYKQYRGDGFEILGVNVDAPGAPIQEYIEQHKVPWPSIHEEGGLQSSIAQQYGVITLPTTFLVDKTGKVVSSAATVDDLKRLVPELVKQ